MQGLANFNFPADVVVALWYSVSLKLDIEAREKLTSSVSLFSPNFRLNSMRYKFCANSASQEAKYEKLPRTVEKSGKKL